MPVVLVCPGAAKNRFVSQPAHTAVVVLKTAPSAHHCSRLYRTEKRKFSEGKRTRIAKELP